MTEPVVQETSLQKQGDGWIARASSVQTTATLNPTSLEGVTQLAAMLQKSPLLPQALRGDMGGTILVLAQTVQMGLPWTVGLKELYVVGNKVSVQARLLRALVERDPNCVKFYVEESSKEKATVVVQRRGMDQPVKVSYTIHDAETAGLTSKNPNYKTRPREMLIARASSLAANTYFPGVCLGLDLDEPEPVYATAEATVEPPLRLPRRRQAKPDPFADLGPAKEAEVVEAEVLGLPPEQEVEEPVDLFLEEPEEPQQAAPEPPPAPKKARAKVEVKEKPGILLVEQAPPTPPVADVTEDDAEFVVDFARNAFGDEAKTILRKHLSDAGISGYGTLTEGVLQLTSAGYSRVLNLLRAEGNARRTAEDVPARGRRV